MQGTTYLTLAQQDELRAKQRKEMRGKALGLLVLAVIVVGSFGLIYWLESVIASALWTDVQEWWYPWGATGALFIALVVLIVATVLATIYLPPRVNESYRNHE